MTSLLFLKRRIKTAQNVSKTTKAMQMIAASKLKKAQNAALLAKPYVEKLSSLTQGLTAKIDPQEQHQYMKEVEEINKQLLIVISPDKGLCGGLISNLIRKAVNLNSEHKNACYITVGKKAEHIVASFDKEIIASFPFGTTLPTFDVVYSILKFVNEYFLNQKVSEVKVLTTHFTNAFTQTPHVSTLLPVKMPKTDTKVNLSSTLFEPNIQTLMPALLVHYLEMSLFQSYLESYASEQASRMISMKNATDNALDIIDELKLEYNKSRQEKITNEILDIGSASFSFAL